MAIGAVQTTVVRLVVSRVARLVGIGVVAGTMASLWLSMFVASLLYRLDPTTLMVAIVVLGAVGITAALLPAVRASRIDPAAELRENKNAQTIR